MCVCVSVWLFLWTSFTFNGVKFWHQKKIIVYFFHIWFGVCVCVISTVTPDAVLNADILLDWRKLWTELWAFLIFDLVLHPLKVPGGLTSVPAFPPPSETRLGSSSNDCRFLLIRVTLRWTYSRILVIFWKLRRRASSGPCTVNGANPPCSPFYTFFSLPLYWIMTSVLLIASSPSRSAFIPLLFQHKQIWETAHDIRGATAVI